jgi:hypothetical protein
MRSNKFDGSYILEFTRVNGQSEYYYEGYYTNGGSLDENVKISILTDTVLINFKSKEY